jgi:DNA-binding NarL/FixJ family response regulator
VNATATKRECGGCGADLTGTHGKRKWCSEACRRAQYGGTCEDCGAPTAGGNGRAKAPKKCAECSVREQTKTERNEKILEMWEQGVPIAEIAADLGETYGTINAWVDSERRLRNRPVSMRRLSPKQTRARWPRIAKRIREGRTNAEIAAEVGAASPSSLAQIIKYARECGYPMPYRAEVRDAA